jgi:hypothetical protein
LEAADRSKRQLEEKNKHVVFFQKGNALIETRKSKNNNSVADWFRPNRVRAAMRP